MIRNMKDEDIDTSDIPPLGREFFASARLRVPVRKISVTFSIDEEILEWFKSQGEDYESRVNAALRIYAQAHQEQVR